MLNPEEQINELKQEVDRLRRIILDKEDENAIKLREDQFRLSTLDKSVSFQQVHKNLDGLNADDHTFYLNNSRHDVTARHGDSIIGTRTIDDAQVPTGNTGSLATLFSWLANMVKSITGETNWRTAPSVTLNDLSGGITEDVVVVTEVDFVAETITTTTLHFVDGIYTGKT